MIMDRIALVLTIIGALNWGSIGIFKFDIVAWICGGQTAVLSRIIYTIVALAGIWCISLLFRPRESYDVIEESQSVYLSNANTKPCKTDFYHYKIKLLFLRLV